MMAPSLNYGDRERICIFGGTLFSRLTPQGRMPVENPKELLQQYAPEIALKADVVVLANTDSTDMHYGEYGKIASDVRDSIKTGYRSITDGQGTDSMTYGAAFLSFRLPFKGYSLKITGSSDKGLGEAGSDAFNNLSVATEIKWPGTYVVMNEGQVMRASRAVKTKPNKVVSGRSVQEKHAFESINYPVIARLGKDGLEYTRMGGPAQRRFLRRQAEKAEFFTRGLDGLYEDPIYLPHYVRVFVIDLHPNFDPDGMDDAYRDGYKVAVIKATGTGGVFNTPKKQALIPKIERWTRNGRSVAVTSRVSKAIVDQEYEVNRRSTAAGAVLCYDMHSEEVIALAEMAGGLAKSPQDFKKIMLYNWEDGITEALIPPEERTTNEELLRILKQADRVNPNWWSSVQRFVRSPRLF